MTRPPPISTLFPYSPPSRSLQNPRRKALGNTLARAMKPPQVDLQGAGAHPGKRGRERRVHQRAHRRDQPLRPAGGDPPGPGVQMSPAVGTFPVASARMYSWSPSLTAAWERLLQWVSARAGVSLEVLNLADPVSLDDLWAREDLGCVFMCGYPWALREDRPHLLAAPVPSPPRYGGKPVYVTRSEERRVGKECRS